MEESVIAGELNEMKRELKAGTPVGFVARIILGRDVRCTFDRNGNRVIWFVDNSPLARNFIPSFLRANAL